MRPNHQTTCERDPATWAVERGEEEGDFWISCVPTGRMEFVTLYDGVLGFGDCYFPYIDDATCSCCAFERYRECRHVAICIALSRFLAREAEKESMGAEERRERCAKEIEECFK